MRGESWLFFWLFVAVSIYAEEGFQYVANYYQHKNYEHATFDELYEDFSSDTDISKSEYRYIINKGLSNFFLTCERMEKLKRSREESHAVSDQLKLTPPSNVAKNFTFQKIVGISNLNPQDAEVTFNASLPYFEVRNKIYLPSIKFEGSADYAGSNQVVDYEMSDVLFSDLQIKKLSDDFEIKLSRSYEKFQINTSKLIIKSLLNYDAQYHQLESDITKEVGKYLPQLVEQVKLTAKNVTLSADIHYLQTVKEKNVAKLSAVVSHAVSSYGRVNNSIPRFNFIDEASSTPFDLISGVFEMDLEKTNVSLALDTAGGFLLTTPAEGSLTYFVTESNCTDSCNTYGDKAKIQAVEVSIGFKGRKLDKVCMELDLVSGNVVGDHYLRKPSENITKSMMVKISKLLSERLLGRLKWFMK